MTTLHKKIINNHIQAFYTGEFDIEQGITKHELSKGMTSRTLWCKLIHHDKKLLRSSGILTTFGDNYVRTQFRGFLKMIQLW